ncbi:hypothetical protein TrST_g10413 [Triparma strigata]|uniref:Uncharacterized protein n=1 Tax=Triparma strigata TaxID=1606541 RepID=A0A9W7C876_9STRA|nr:hypothetical protein TrST_g10413 [Triparma strigata]
MTKSYKRNTPTQHNSRKASPTLEEQAQTPLLDPNPPTQYSSTDSFFQNSSHNPPLNQQQSKSRGSSSSYAQYKQNRPKKPSDHHHRKSERVLDRSGYFKQSKGEWKILRKGGAWLYAPFYWDDWFHSLLNAPTRRIFALLFIVYLLSVLLFAFVYMLIATEGEGGDKVVGGGCGMDITNMMEAYYFSLSTMTTLGYGVSDYYFGDCWSPLVFITTQVFISITFDAVAIGVIFQRLSRVQKRARTIVFSDKAIIRRIRGRLFFMFQCSELRKHQLVEAHVRVYCVRHERAATNASGRNEREESDSDGEEDLRSYSDGEAASSKRRKEEKFDVETAYFQTHNVRLQHPDDELGAFLLMALPNVVVHRIDEWSPLCAPALWYDEKGRRHMWRGMIPPNLESIGVDEDIDNHEEEEKYAKIQSNSVVKGFPELLQRACDKEADARVLLQTEYGMSRRRQSAIVLNRGLSSPSINEGANPNENAPNKRNLSDSDIKLPIDANESADGTSEEAPQHRKGHSESSVTMENPPDLTRSASNDGLGRKPPSINTNLPSKKHPYGSNNHPAETPRQRAKRRYQISEQREIKAFLKDRDAELVVLVEGIDVMTSATLQARHSYRWDDIVWHHTFAPCVERRMDEENPKRSNGCVIDFSKFHDLVPVANDADSCGLVPNIG